MSNGPIYDEFLRRLRTQDGAGNESSGGLLDKLTSDGKLYQAQWKVNDNETLSWNTDKWENNNYSLRFYSGTWNFEVFSPAGNTNVTAPETAEKLTFIVGGTTYILKKEWVFVAKVATERPEDDAVYGMIYNPSASSPVCQRVRWVNGSLIEVSEFNELPAHRWRRCVMDNLSTRHVNYYLSDTDSNKRADGSAATLTGADGDVMVEIPVTYWRIDTMLDGRIVYLVSRKEFPGSSVHPFFYVSPTGRTVRTQYVGAYIANASDSNGTILNTNQEATASAAYSATNKLRSVSGAKPFTNTNLANARTMARNNGGQVCNGLFYQFMGLMMAIEYGSLNSQGAISEGFTNVSASGVAYTYLRNAGRSNFGNGTGHTLMNAELDASISWGSTTDNKKIVAMQYRGVENPYGCVWQFEDGMQKWNNIRFDYIMVSGVKYLRDADKDNGANRAFTDEAGTLTYWVKTLYPGANTVCYTDNTCTTDSGLKTTGTAEAVLYDGCYWHTAATNDYTSADQQNATNPVYGRTPHDWPAEGYPKTVAKDTFYPTKNPDGSIGGGGTTTYICDYFYNSIGDISTRSVLRGGNLNIGARAGCWYVNLAYGLSSALWSFGFRLAA